MIGSHPVRVPLRLINIQRLRPTTRWTGVAQLELIIQPRPAVTKL